MSVKLLTKHHFEFQSLKGGFRGSSESTHLKMSNCWKSHVLFLIFLSDCLSLPNPENGNVNTVGGTTYGEVARYYCNVGYSLVGMAERACEADGRWSGTPPVCKIKGMMCKHYGN